MFEDRYQAGEKLADKLSQGIVGRGSLKDKVLVLGIPRGGVVLAKVIADQFKWPLEVLITKKIGFPNHEELAMGAVAEGGEPVWDERLSGQVSKGEKDKQEQVAREKVGRYIKEFRGGRKLRVKDKTVVVVDDGIATGRTAEAGIKYLQGQALKVIVATPVCARETANRLKSMVDEWVCLKEPKLFYAVGQFYKAFEQVSDEEVLRLLVR